MCAHEFLEFHTFSLITLFHPFFFVSHFVILFYLFFSHLYSRFLSLPSCLHLVDSCIRSLDRIGVSGRRESSVAWPRKKGRHAVSKFQRAVSMKIAIKDSQRSNSAVRFKREKAVSERRANKSESLRLHSVQQSCVWCHLIYVVSYTPYKDGQGLCI